MRLYMTNQHSEERKVTWGAFQKHFVKSKKYYRMQLAPTYIQDKNFSCLVISNESAIKYLNRPLH